MHYGEGGQRRMQITTTQKRAIDHYYLELSAYHEKKVTHETAVRSAFQNLLAAFAQSANWVLIPEQTLANGKRPDGTLRDSFNLPRGYWEAKDTRDDLGTEIRKKITAGYLISNTIAREQGNPQPLSAAALEEVIRLYGLRQWVEQSYKQVKHVLGWAQYQVRSDQAIRRHWQLVCCAFSFCWYHASHSCSWVAAEQPEASTEVPMVSGSTDPTQAAETGKKKQPRRTKAIPNGLASSTTDGASLVGTLGPAVALLASVEQAAPAACFTTPA